MKELVILGKVMLLVLLSVATIVGCQQSAPATPTPPPTTSPPTATPVESNNQYNIDNKFYLSLVKHPDGRYAGAADGNLIVLINNREAKDPTYNELIEFLKNDWTDSYLSMGFGITGFFYGDPWNSVKIDYYKDWIEFGTGTPGAIFYIKYPMSHPLRDRKKLMVCADFAEVLHNNAELFGIKAAWVAINFEEGPGHALNAFQTTDRGLVFIDCTGQSFEDAWKIRYDKPDSWDKLAHVKEGRILTHSPIDNQRGSWQSMGIVKTIEVYWD